VTRDLDTGTETRTDVRAGTTLRFGTETFYASIGRALVAMCVVVPVLFGIELLDYWLANDLVRQGGIRPRHVGGLDGVVFAPLLHVSFTHLYGNSVPLILLGTFVLAAGARPFIASTLFIMVFSGLGVWLVGDPNSVVVGASAVIFGYLGLLLARGFIERRWWHLWVALVAGLLYGWQITGLLPGAVDPRVSWEGHLFGFVGGMVAALLFRAVPSRRAAIRAVPSQGAVSGGTD
jgi:membrane associated rhomboid family serine protease